MTTVTSTLTRPDDELRHRFLGLRSAQDVARLLEIRYVHLAYILYDAPNRYRYRTFDIPKKSGGSRRISVPPSSIGILQHKLLKVLKLVHRPKEPSHGVTENTSIVTNARLHVHKDFVLNIDLVDFFHAITFWRIRGMFMAKPYSIHPAAATVLAQLCCHDQKLPQGGPTSPIVADMVCGRLDGQMIQLAKQFRCSYTRYLDDITISTNARRFPRRIASSDFTDGAVIEIGDALKDVIETKNGFVINQQKVRMQTKGHHQEVTGLVVNAFPNIPHTYAHRLRALIHHLKHDTGNEVLGREAVGRLAYIQMVRGKSDPVYRRLRTQLHEAQPNWIDQPEPLPEPDPAAVSPEDLMVPADLWKSVYSERSPNVLQLEAKRGSGNVLGGTAFVLTDGLVVTAAHNVVNGNIVVWTADGVEVPVPPESIAIHDHWNTSSLADVAILSLPELKSPRDFSVRKQAAKPGEQIAALGFPAIGARQTSLAIKAGMVEGIARSYDGNEESMTVSCEISGGMSGGPVVDRFGAVVGIVMERTINQPNPDLPGEVERHIVPVSYLAELLETREL